MRREYFKRSNYREEHRGGVFQGGVKREKYSRGGSISKGVAMWRLISEEGVVQGE